MFDLAYIFLNLMVANYSELRICAYMYKLSFYTLV